MDYGPGLSATFEVHSDVLNFAYKEIAIQLMRGQGGKNMRRSLSLTIPGKSNKPLIYP